MDLKPAIQKLEKSPEFREWHKNHKSTYFSYAFKIPQEMGENDWQLGFYDKKKDKITTFMIAGDNIKIRPEEEIFKREETKVSGVNLEKVKIVSETIIAKAKSL